MGSMQELYGPSTASYTGRAKAGPADNAWPAYGEYADLA